MSQNQFPTVGRRISEVRQRLTLMRINPDEPPQMFANEEKIDAQIYGTPRKNTIVVYDHASLADEINDVTAGVANLIELLRAHKQGYGIDSGDLIRDAETAKAEIDDFVEKFMLKLHFRPDAPKPEITY